MDLKIASLNVRGIGNNLKRRDVFNWLRSKKLSIYMLQEVHCSENTADLWACEWGYKTLFSCCSSSKAGVSILFNNTFNLQFLKVFSDPNGRFIICDIEANNKLLKGNSGVKMKQFCMIGLYFRHQYLITVSVDRWFEARYFTWKTSEKRK